MYSGNSEVTSITKCRQEECSMETVKGQKGKRYTFTGHLVWGMAKFPVLCHAKKKTASDTTYLSDSLQGQLLHEVNFISFFQMFVLQN